MGIFLIGVRLRAPELHVRDYMKAYQAALLAIAASALAFYGGLQLGLTEGAKQFSLANGLLRAEMSRHMLASLDKEGIEEVRGILATELVGGLNEHYELIHYKPLLLLRPESKFIFENNKDKEFIRRISAYAAMHPEAIRLSFDPTLLPESTPEEVEFKRSTVKGKEELEGRVRWVLSQAATHTSAGQPPAQAGRP